MNYDGRLNRNIQDLSQGGSKLQEWAWYLYFILSHNQQNPKYSCLRIYILSTV